MSSNVLVVTRTSCRRCDSTTSLSWAAANGPATDRASLPLAAAGEDQAAPDARYGVRAVSAPAGGAAVSRGCPRSSRPARAAEPGSPASARNRLSRASCGRCVSDHSSTSGRAPRRCRRLPPRPARGQPDARVRRGPRRPCRLRGGERPALELLGLAEVSARERDPAEPGQREGCVVGKPCVARERERTLIRVGCGAFVAPALGDPGLEQQRGDLERIEPDGSRVTVRLRRHGGDRVHVSRESGDLGPQEAGHRDAPVVAGRLEASVRLLRQHGGALASPASARRARAPPRREPPAAVAARSRRARVRRSRSPCPDRAPPSRRSTGTPRARVGARREHPRTR